MLLKFSVKMEWRSQKALAEERIDQVDQSGAFVGVSAEILAIVGGNRAPAEKIEELSATITAHGGHSALRKACCREVVFHLKLIETRNSAPFSTSPFSPSGSNALLNQNHPYVQSIEL
jgi:hypothetical protein